MRQKGYLSDRSIIGILQYIAPELFPWMESCLLCGLMHLSMSEMHPYPIPGVKSVACWPNWGLLLLARPRFMTVGQVFKEESHALEHKHHMQLRDNAAARNCLDGETTATDHWTHSNKVKAPWDMIRTLQIPGSNPPEHVTH
jgi:hypothetical protein